MIVGGLVMSQYQLSVSLSARAVIIVLLSENKLFLSIHQSV